LYRGLWIKTRSRNLRPKLVSVSGPKELASLGDASIIAVGVKKSAPLDVQRKMMEYGWQPGQRHAVVVMKADPQGKWLDIADPTFGRERWPTKDIEYLWDGQALYLSPQ
jgi:hypothetical protein